MDGRQSFYSLKTYVNEKRWASYFGQIQAILESFEEPKKHSVLELGPGRNLLRNVLKEELKIYKTYDVDDRSGADFKNPKELEKIKSGSFDCVVAFQVLEHMPIEESLELFDLMVNLSSDKVIISLPNSKQVWSYSIYIPRKGTWKFSIPNLLAKQLDNVPDGNHYWELEKKGYEVHKVLDFLLKNKKVTLDKHYRLHDHSYHHFFVFSKN